MLLLVYTDIQVETKEVGGNKLKTRKLTFALGIAILFLGIGHFLIDLPKMLIFSASVAAFIYSLHELLDRGNEILQSTIIERISSILFYSVFSIPVVVYVFLSKISSIDNEMDRWNDFLSLISLGMAVIILSWERHGTRHR